MGCRDLIRSQLWYNSVGGDQIEIWWVVETGSEVNYGIIAWALTKTRSDGRQQYTFESRIQWKKNTEKKIGQKATSWLTMIVHLGIDLCCANDLGVCSGRQRQTFNNWTHNVCHDSSESVFDTDCNGMRHFFEDNGVRERWIFIITSLHWCATCRLLLQQYWKVKCPTIWNQNKKHGNDPPKTMGIGSFTTIHRASKC